LAVINPFQNKYSKQYYQAVMQPPVIFLSAERIFGVAGGDSGNSRNALEEGGRNVLEKGSPILGEEACASVKDSISDRWVHYQTALAIFLSSPLAGVGANRYGHYSCTGPGWFPHSTILQVLAELGILGALVYGLLILAAVYAILQRYFSSDHLMTKVIAGWVLAYLAFQLATNQLYGNYFMSAGLYFVIGIASRFAIDADPRRVKA
jgi:O-Antigen ligase